MIQEESHLHRALANVRDYFWTALWNISSRKLCVNCYNPFEAYVGSESIGDGLIFRRSNMSCTFDGDIVAVELQPQEQWQEEKSLAIAGEGCGVTHSLFVSKDRRLAKIGIQTRQSRYPSGHYIQAIGEIGDGDTESEEMTPEADIISSRFTKSVIKSSAALSYVEAQARMDDRISYHEVARNSLCTGK